MTNTLITRSMVASALKDDAFYASMPEFLVLKVKADTAKAGMANCKGCRGRENPKNLLSDFLATVSVLDDAAIRRLKSYLGIESMMFNTHEPRTGAYITKVL